MHFGNSLHLLICTCAFSVVRPLKLWSDSDLISPCLGCLIELHLPSRSEAEVMRCAALRLRA